MFDQATCADTRSATSSLALADGALRFGWLDGQTIDLFGPVPVLANLSARQAKDLGLLTSGTCGLRSSTLSASVALQQSLASRLQAATASTGSTLYALTWKVRPTPLGRPICALRASVRRTSVSGSTGWPTPLASDHRPGHESRAHSTVRSNLNDRAVLAGWPTATATDAHRGEKCDPFAPNTTMNMAAQLCGWPTPGVAVLEHKSKPPVLGNRKPTDPQISTADIAFHLCTPIRYTASGQVLTGSDAGMANSGQLRPAHSRWLMGYPMAWDGCGIAALSKSKKR